MIHQDLSIEQDQAMCLLVAKALEASRAAMNAMHGQPIDAEMTLNHLLEACVALRVAFPGDTDRQTLRMLLIKSGLAAALTDPPANDRHPVGTA